MNSLIGGWFGGNQSREEGDWFWRLGEGMIFSGLGILIKGRRPEDLPDQRENSEGRRGKNVGEKNQIVREKELPTM